ncbi:histidine phosphotransferase ChpT [Bartonella ancashensis]|uniref:Signal transduction histidine kinase n=1 Tax=Bartonella ancashensis TaxID=1318743 RepID=A0A0M4LGI5_9HYPH|nr:histidine phosphotransferase family protein [Bartonella ancashensis]ALE03557.1 Signal transduction histidine kinase [Bartonella ancashensis]
MMLAASLKSVDFANLLCSRICHDLVSPISAIQNAMELYDEGGVNDDALELIRFSVAKASAHLQFARLAFGAAGSVDCQIDTNSVRHVVEQYMAEEKAVLRWQVPSLLLPKDEVKLLLNLLLVANMVIPRAGEIIVTVIQDAAIRSLFFEIHGKILRVPSYFVDLYSGRVPREPVDARTVQFYYTVHLAEISAMKISTYESGDHIILESRKEL